MIKEIKSTKEVVTRIKCCDVCGAEIKHKLACNVLICLYCKKDLCEDCIGHEEETGSDDLRTVWCKQCWDIGNVYRPEIDALTARITALYKEWQDRCKE